MGHFILGQLAGLAIGWVVGCFTPGVYRTVKGWLGKETKYVEGQVKSGVGSVTKHL